MAARKYRCTWDDIPALHCEHIASWGALSGFSGHIPEIGGTQGPDKLFFEHDAATDRCAIIYTWDKKEDDTPIRSTVHLVRRSCRFGGTRPYFQCPDCGRATLRLAILPEGARCGNCGRIQHKSRNQSETARLVRKANRIARKLDMDYFGDPIQRPPRMRAETFAQIVAELEPVKTEINRRVMIRAARAKGPLGAFPAMVRWGL